MGMTAEKRRTRAHKIIEDSTHALLKSFDEVPRVVFDPSAKFVEAWRADKVERHVKAMMNLFDNAWHHCFSDSEHRGYRERWAKIPSWQQARVTMAGLPYSGQTIWVRGRPVLMNEPGWDVWREIPVSPLGPEPTRFYESNLLSHGVLVYVRADAVELLGEIRRNVTFLEIEPATGTLPVDKLQGEQL
jgi:hypothetical protein